MPQRNAGMCHLFVVCEWLRWLPSGHHFIQERTHKYSMNEWRKTQPNCKFKWTLFDRRRKQQEKKRFLKVFTKLSVGRSVGLVASSRANTHKHTIGVRRKSAKAAQVVTPDDMFAFDRVLNAPIVWLLPISVEKKANLWKVEIFAWRLATTTTTGTHSLRHSV